MRQPDSQNDLEHKGFRFFAGVGRFAVRWRWLIVLVWVVGTVLAVQKLPSLSSAIQSNNANFLPASAPTEKAIKLASAFGTTNNTSPEPVVVATKTGQRLSATDQLAINNLAAKLRSVPHVEKVQDVGLSADGQADELEVLANVGAMDPTDFIGNLRGTIAHAGLPADLQAHLAGADATAVDNNHKSGNQNTQLELGSALFIIVLLLLIFRAPLAPLVTFLPALLVASLAGPIIAEIARHGLKVSPFAEFLLTVLILGAGTDYALFLIFRVREEMQGGLASKEAIVRALSRVGESITFSAATVIAALLSLLLASFEIYSDLGAPLAIGIGLMLLAGLTLLPALLAIFGRAVFWPSKRYKKPGKYGLWGRICAHVVRRPARVLIVGVIVFGGLALAVTGYKAGGFGGQTTAPAGSDSAKGTALLAKHYPQSSANPTGVLFVLPQSVWQDPAPLYSLQSQMDRATQFNGVSGPLNSGGAQLTAANLKRLYGLLGPPKNLAAQESAVAHQASVPPGVYDVYRSLSNYISPDGKTVQFAVGLSAGDPSTTAAMNATPDVRNKVSGIARGVGATDSGVAGEASAFYDISAISNSDLKKVIPVAILVIGLLLAILMRSLVAPLYLVASVALSYLAALGLTVLVFIYIAGSSGLVFLLPLLMFLFLLALGEDYNILVMTRIREEAHGMSLPKAVTQALNTTGTTVTSAGLVLAGTFSVLAVVAGSQSTQIRDVAAGLAIGILMDTFLVRTLMVPSTVVLLGRLNWWPTKHGSWIEEDE